ncbi:putative linker histone H1/H5, domain H15, winged helix-like DNA-binding domain superfamily [Helianthus debilis subsp. tardiflorus]
MASAKAAITKKAPAAKKPRSHPPYAEMVKEAIVALKEKTGSSQYAIAKHIEDNQKDLPANFKKLLLLQLKKLVAAGKLTKVKNSFKLQKPADQKKPLAVKAKSGAQVKVKTPVKAKKVAAPAKKAVKAKSGGQVKAKGKAKTPVKAKKVAVPAKKVKSIKSPAKKKSKK